MKPRSKSINANRMLNAVKSISAHPIRDTNCVNLQYDDEPRMTYAEFSKLAKKTEAEFEGKTNEQMEDLFWDGLRDNKMLYGMDNQFSLFPDDYTVWNLSKFTQKESLIHRVIIIYFFSSLLITWAFSVFLFRMTFGRSRAFIPLTFTSVLYFHHLDSIWKMEIYIPKIIITAGNQNSGKIQIRNKYSLNSLQLFYECHFPIKGISFPNLKMRNSKSWRKNSDWNGIVIFIFVIKRSWYHHLFCGKMESSSLE